jgi:hypothetical protein
MVGRHYAARLAGVCVRLYVHFMVAQLVPLCGDPLRIVDHAGSLGLALLRYTSAPQTSCPST